MIYILKIQQCLFGIVSRFRTRNLKNYELRGIQLMLTNIIPGLVRFILHAITLLSEFIALQLLGLIAGILIILLWVLRAFALIG